MEQEKNLCMNRKELEAYLENGLKENVILIIEDGNAEEGKEIWDGRKKPECGTGKAD